MTPTTSTQFHPRPYESAVSKEDPNARLCMAMLQNAGSTIEETITDLSTQTTPLPIQPDCIKAILYYAAEHHLTNTLHTLLGTTFFANHITQHNINQALIEATAYNHLTGINTLLDTTVAGGPSQEGISAARNTAIIHGHVIQALEPHQLLIKACSQGNVSRVSALLKSAVAQDPSKRKPSKPSHEDRIEAVKQLLKAGEG